MRARNLKPSFFKNEDLADCSAFARLLFAGMWGLADRNGNLENRPRLLKAEIFPHDTLQVSELVSELANHGLIILYTVKGQKLIAIPSWLKHARPHHSEPVCFPVLDENAETPALSEFLQSALENSGEVALNAECGMLNAESPFLNAPSVEDGASPKKEKHSSAKAGKAFDQTPPGLAQQWLSGRNGLRGRTPNKDEYLAKTTEFFEELVDQGVTGADILAAILAKRDRSEYLFKFKDRLLKAREPPRAEKSMPASDHDLAHGTYSPTTGLTKNTKLCDDPECKECAEKRKK